MENCRSIQSWTLLTGWISWIQCIRDGSLFEMFGSFLKYTSRHSNAVWYSKVLKNRGDRVALIAVAPPEATFGPCTASSTPHTEAVTPER